jgi:hypothetical protein
MNYPYTFIERDALSTFFYLTHALARYFLGIALDILSPICTQSSLIGVFLLPNNPFMSLCIKDTAFSQNRPRCLRKAVETQPRRR